MKWTKKMLIFFLFVILLFLIVFFIKHIDKYKPIIYSHTVYKSNIQPYIKEIPLAKGTYHIDFIPNANGTYSTMKL